eukprot:gene10848-12058_t
MEEGSSSCSSSSEKQKQRAIGEVDNDISPAGEEGGLSSNPHFLHPDTALIPPEDHLLYAECSLATCGLSLAEKETTECSKLLSLLRRRFKMNSAIIVEKNAHRILFTPSSLLRHGYQSFMTCPDIILEPRMPSSIKDQLKYSIRGYLGINVILSDGRRGTLILTSRIPRRFDSNDIMFACEVSAMIEERYQMRRDADIANTIANLTIISVLMSSIKCYLATATTTLEKMDAIYSRLIDEEALPASPSAASQPLCYEQQEDEANANSLMAAFGLRIRTSPTKKNNQILITSTPRSAHLEFSATRQEPSIGSILHVPGTPRHESAWKEMIDLLPNFDSINQHLQSAIERALVVAKNYTSTDKTSYYISCFQTESVGFVQTMNTILQGMSKLMPDHMLMWSYAMEPVLAHCAHRTFYAHLVFFLEGLILRWAQYCSSAQVTIQFESHGVIDYYNPRYHEIMNTTASVSSSEKKQQHSINRRSVSTSVSHDASEGDPETTRQYSRRRSSSGLGDAMDEGKTDEIEGSHDENVGNGSNSPRVDISRGLTIDCSHDGEESDKNSLLRATNRYHITARPRARRSTSLDGEGQEEEATTSPRRRRSSQETNSTAASSVHSSGGGGGSGHNKYGRLQHGYLRVFFQPLDVYDGDKVKPILLKTATSLTSNSESNPMSNHIIDILNLAGQATQRAKWSPENSLAAAVAAAGGTMGNEIGGLNASAAMDGISLDQQPPSSFMPRRLSALGESSNQPHEAALNASLEMLHVLSDFLQEIDPGSSVAIAPFDTDGVGSPATFMILIPCHFHLPLQPPQPHPTISRGSFSAMADYEGVSQEMLDSLHLTRDYGNKRVFHHLSVKKNRPEVDFSYRQRDASDLDYGARIRRNKNANKPKNQMTRKNAQLNATFPAETASGTVGAAGSPLTAIGHLFGSLVSGIKSVASGVVHAPAAVIQSRHKQSQQQLSVSNTSFGHLHGVVPIDAEGYKQSR